MEFQLKFISPNEKNIFLKYNEPESLLQPFEPQYRMTPEEIEEFNNSPKETCISVLRVKMKQFKIEMFKNYVGN